MPGGAMKALTASVASPSWARRSSVALFLLRSSSSTYHGEALAQDTFLYSGIPFADLPVKLRQPGPFECISYVWGDTRQTRQIYCGSEVLNVTYNLWDALHRIQSDIGSSRKKTRFWADQICINQKSIQEKEEQVPLMCDVFQCAAKVHCWLGVQRTAVADSSEHVELV